MTFASFLSKKIQKSFIYHRYEPYMSLGFVAQTQKNFFHVIQYLKKLKKDFYFYWHKETKK